MFTPATKKNAKLMAAIFGPSGSGKTFTSLAIASGMGERIALIDSERGSASKYADRFRFDVLTLESRTIDDYLPAIKAASSAGYHALILDSITHPWQELSAEIDALAQREFRGNTWAAWSKGSIKQRAFIDALYNSKMHIVATMRSRTEWITGSDAKGKSKPVRVGLSPEQGKGIEYEFDLLIQMDADHNATIIKDRTGKYQDKTIATPGQAFGRELAQWLNDDLASPPSLSSAPSAGEGLPTDDAPPAAY